MTTRFNPKVENSCILLVILLISTFMNAQVGSHPCTDPQPIANGYSENIISQSSFDTWYTFVATDTDFEITLEQFNGGFIPVSLGRMNIKIYGPFEFCNTQCPLQSNPSSSLVYQDVIVFNDDFYEMDEMIESYTIPASELTNYPHSGPGLYYLNATVWAGINVPPGQTVINLNLNWSFEMYGAQCCWPEEPSQPSLYAYCDNFYNLTPGLNQSINFPVSSTGVNEFWMASTSPAGLQLPAGSLEFSYAPGNSDDPCAFNSSPANSNQAIRIEQYGPFDACSEPCEQFNLNPVALDTISPVNYGTSGFDIGTFSIPSGDAEQLWLYRIIYEVKCAPCEFALSYDLTGAISGFSTPDDLQASCTNCLPVQGLLPEKKYIVTAWVKDADIASYEETIEDAEVKVVFDGGTVVGNTSVPSGPIIDGWQQIECEFTTPQTFFDFNIELNSLDGIVYFDDVRLFPYDGSMKCYVYDPQNLRFVAELDERHFATLYEYDEEGRLMRIKKETERGVMTIQESKTSTVKRANVPD